MSELSEEQIYEDLRIILEKKLDLYDWEVTGQTSLTEDLGADGAQLYDIFTAVERHWGIHIPYDEIAGIEEVNHLITAIRRHAITEI